jgi:hypothetical protein
MSTSRRSLSILTILLFLAIPMLAQAPPSADTFVSNTTPTLNYGSSITLIVGSGTTSYMQFNLSGIPIGASVNKAMLRLYVDGVSKNGSFDVYQLNGSWSEGKLTYNSAPALGASATGGHPISITSASRNQFLLIDITSLVQGWVNGTTANNGVALALTSGSTGYFSFDSKESLLTGNGPELEIAVTGLAGPPGPQGPAGAQGAQGAAGATGPQGAQGPQGPIGLTGAQGPAGISFNFRSAFDNSASYAANDVVSYSGSSYVAVAASQGPNNPTPDQNASGWKVMAAQGAAGLNWRGAFDCFGTYAVGDVVSYQGSSYVDVNFGIGGCVQPPATPWQLLAQQGQTGSTGATGSQGPQGTQGPQGIQGAPGIDDAQGPQGPQGPPGPGSNAVMVLSGYIKGDLGSGGVGAAGGYIVLERAINIKHVSAVALGNSGSGCSNPATVELWIPFQGVFYSLSLTQGSAIWDSGSLSIPQPAGTQLHISSAAATGCDITGGSPSDVFVSVQYEMQ